MPKRAFSWVVAFWVAALAPTALIALGCSSSASPTTPCTSGTSVACTCPGGQSGTEACGSSVCTCASAEAGDGGAETPDADVPGDATHRDEQPAPPAAYAACALPGSFGWPCTSAISGLDPAECTDPSFPYCFAGAQGGRCTALCGDAGVTSCPLSGSDAGDAGCVPTDCNARGYCK
jgi:hypothetical protein